MIDLPQQEFRRGFQMGIRALLEILRKTDLNVLGRYHLEKAEDIARGMRINPLEIRDYQGGFENRFLVMLGVEPRFPSKDRPSS